MLNSFYLSHEQYQALPSPESGTKLAVIASVNDNLLPSFSEVNRLERLIPGLYTMALPYGGHAAAMDPRCNLAAFLRALNNVKESLTNGWPPKASEGVLRRRAACRKRFSSRAPQARDSFPRQEMRAILDYVEASTREFLPLFIGEENLREYDPERPVLFVGNHSLMKWLDAAHPVKRISTSRGVLIRALAHPYLFTSGTMNFPMVASADIESLKKFGVTAISPSSLVQNLSLGKWSMMFPGGATEALKDPRGRKCELFWPQEPEFVRSCAFFGAQIIPLSSVGVEDS
ncbi:hypothetical protein FGB62_33g00 [Gracilaria domingensis]|nr:hypothetical protein FGB62_33g00 [Gracilaria domingensis]